MKRSTGAPTPMETELKLAFPPEARGQIEHHPAFGGAHAASPRTAQ